MTHAGGILLPCLAADCSEPIALYKRLRCLHRVGLALVANPPNTAPRFKQNPNTFQSEICLVPLWEIVSAAGTTRADRSNGPRKKPEPLQAKYYRCCSSNG